MEAIADGDIEVKLAWREGMLVFRGSSLDEAVREVGRYTHLEFVVQSEDLKAMRWPVCSKPVMSRAFLPPYVPTLMWLTGELMKRPSRFP